MNTKKSNKRNTWVISNIQKKRKKLDEEHVLKNKSANKNKNRTTKKSCEDKRGLTDSSEENETAGSKELSESNDLSESSNEELEIEEAGSGDDLEVEDEGNSDKEVKNDDEDNSDEESSSNELLNDEEVSSDEETNKVDKFEANKEAEVYIDSDEEAIISGVSEEDVEENAKKLTEKVKNFSVLVNGITDEENIKELFQDCKIMYYDLIRKYSNKLSGTAFVYFEDEKSFKKAISKNGKILNDNMVQVEKLNNSSLTVFVDNLDPAADIEEIFQGCKIESYKRVNANETRAFVHFKNEKSVNKALFKNNTVVNNRKLLVRRYDDNECEIKTSTQVHVTNLHPNTNIEDIFIDCRIVNVNIINTKNPNKSTGRAYIDLADEESVQKALLKDKTVHEGCLIRVSRSNCNVLVQGLNPNSKLRDVFTDCKINYYRILKTKMGNYQGSTYINFKDVESVKNAIMKNRTEFGGRILLVKLCTEYGENGRKIYPPFVSKNQHDIKPKFKKGVLNDLQKKQLKLKNLKAKHRKYQQKSYNRK